MNLEIIIASTRPGRVGEKVAKWFIEEAKTFRKFNVSIADLAEINLPLLDEPNHPRFQKYTKEHTKEWSERIKKDDAFVVITPEYNFYAPATIINAFDYLYIEWNYKPIGFVSYGGISGGTRSVQQEKLIATTLRMFPVYEAVNIPFVHNYISDGKFVATENFVDMANSLLSELYRLASVLKPLYNR